MKEMTSVTEVMMTEEEKEEIKGAAGKTPLGGSPAASPTVTPGVPHPEQKTATEHTAATPATPLSPVTQDGPAEPATAATSTAPTPSTSDSTHVAPTPSGSSTPTKERLEKEHANSPRKRAKLTPEQKAKIDQIGEDRDKAMDSRIEELTRKLKDVSLA